jgi:hypothetical protein
MKLQQNLNKKTSNFFRGFWFERVHITSEMSNSLHEELNEIASLFIQ